MARWNVETRGIQAAFRGKPICARCDRPTFGPGLCSDCHTRFRQGLSDALFTIGAMVAVPCVVGAAFLWFAHGREITGGEMPENATIILGRAMGPDAANIFRHLAISALTAALLSIGSFLLLDLPRVLRRDKRLEIDWRDMIASLRDIRLLFEKRVTPAGPRPGEPESANPLDYQTAMQQIHNMLGIEGEIPPDPAAEKDEPATEATGDPPPRGSAVRDVETVESLIAPRRENRPQGDLSDEPDEAEPVAATRPDQVADTAASVETARESAVEEDLPEPAAEATAPPLPAARPPEPLAAEVDEVPAPSVGDEPEPADIGEDPPPSPAGAYESGDVDEEPPPEQDPCIEEPPADEPDDGHEHAGPTGPTVQVKDSPFAQRHRLRQPLFETTPPPPSQDEDEEPHALPRRRSVVDDLLDEPVAQLFDRPALPGLLQVKISEWDDLPTTEFVPEDRTDLGEQTQPPGSPEIEWLDEEEASADLDEADILDIECVPAQTDQTPTPETTRPQEDEPPVAETAEPENEKAPDPAPASGPATESSVESAPSAEEETDRSTTNGPADARILLRGPKGSSGIETSLTDADGNVACPGCGRRKPSPGPGRYNCSSCQTEFVIPRVLARCPGCGRERPSPGPGVYQCSQCTTTFRIPPMVSCPGCGRSKPSPGTGRLRCSACGTVFEVINETGAVR